MGDSENRYHMAALAAMEVPILRQAAGCFELQVEVDAPPCS